MNTEGLRITMHSDNGSEFQKEFAAMCKKYNITQSFTVPETPEQNSVVERYWRSLLAPSLAMLFSSKLDKRLFPYAFSFVNDIILN